ncbi:Vacuolar calcium ion transporter [Pleurostoma richardsiae]|uniref:Vacuolar calcium ion transporter n=1 Tax=Pleurostoma richardsiae TaxID=41990 RepID=A0AA38VQQ3_9PEZI|nr:Vacuolar calcium ion transporter [Pleurostoma richardsiae]
MERYMDPTMSDLLDIFTNNTVQVISSVLLLKAKQIDILQTSLIGVILSNILVLLGLSLLSGGIMNHEQRFNRIGAQGSSSLLSIAATSLLFPTSVKLLDQTTPESLVLQSRGVAVVLLFVYFTYTFCQMGTHKKDYSHSDKPEPQATRRGRLKNPDPDGHLSDEQRTIERLLAQMGGQTALAAIEPIMRRNTHSLPVLIDSQKLPRAGVRTPDNREGESKEIMGPHLAFSVATFVLTQQASLSSTFVGLTLLPIPNCDFAPITLALDDCLEQTMKYTVGRSIQTALLVEPLVVLVAWAMGIGGVTLAFDGFEIVSLFTTILLLNFLVVDTKVHWVHGVLLLADWVLIGIAAFFVTPEVLD